LVAAGVLAATFPAWAQQRPSDAPPFDTTQSSAPVDPERLALARELFGLMHLDIAMRGMIGNIVKLPDEAGQSNARAREFMSSYSSAFDASLPTLVDAMTVTYARELTTQELRDSVVFYRGPSGQAILHKMPVLMQQIAPLTLKLMPGIAAATEKDFCGRETCTDAEHAMFRRMEALGNAKTTAPGG
jgi:hypothetical protein